MKKKKIIDTDRLILREPSLNDLNDWFEIFNSDKVGAYLKKYTERDEVLSLLERKINKFANQIGSSYSIVEKKSNKVIGNFEIKFNEETKIAEISYVINENFWGNGYATECAFGILAYAFNDLGAIKVIADCRENNFASIHMLEKKIKMDFVKFEKDYIYDEKINKYIGFNFYELTKEKYENL